MTLPPRLEDAFAAAAGELGHVSAAWLFVREVTRDWPQGATALRDALGRAFPIADAVAAQALEGRRAPTVDAAPAVAALEGCKRVVLVGYEADFVDPLVAALGGIEFHLLTQGSLEADWDRVLANHQGKVTPIALSRVQAQAGPKSALVTFLYGSDGARTHVVPEWLRLLGPDTRTQFRALVGWEALQGPLHVYPRWLEQTETEAFTHLI